MSAAAVSFFLDRDGHKKFLRVATNQELEAENKKLKEELAGKTEECSHWYTEARSYERSWEIAHTSAEEMESELAEAIRQRDHFKKGMFGNFNLYQKVVKDKRELEERIQTAVTKALHPDWPNSEDDEDKDSQMEDNSPSPSFGDAPELHDESDPAYQGGNDGNPEGFF